jgi:hypothetical protein
MSDVSLIADFLLLSVQSVFQLCSKYWIFSGIPISVVLIFISAVYSPIKTFTGGGR